MVKVLKEFFVKVNLFFSLDKKIKDEIINKGFGIPFKIISKNKESYSICPSNAPIEYCSMNCFKEEITYLTDKNNKVKVTEIYEDNYSYNIELLV